MKFTIYPWLLLAVTTDVLHAESIIEITSGPDDFTGRGNSYVYTSNNAVIQYSQYDDNGITVDIDNYPGHSPIWWTLDITAPDNAKIQPGLYENVARIPFQNAGQPGLLFSGNGRYCNALTGWFEVFSVKYNQVGGIESLDMEFEQRCVGYSSSLHGKISFNTTAHREDLFGIY
jgi:hypothetical protein